MPSAPPQIDIPLRVHAVNGESAGWDDRRGILYFVDMRGPALHAFTSASGKHDWWQMPDWIGCFALLEDGRLVVALRTGLHLFDPAMGSLRFVAPPPYDPRRFCFNDGRCDRQGAIHRRSFPSPAGARRSAPRRSAEAPTWRFDGRDRLEPLPLHWARSGNGLALSPNGATLYHAATHQKTIWAWDYDVATGALGNGRVFARIEQGDDDSGPDGAVVDRDGFYTGAVFGAGCLLRFDPAGKLERRIALPVRYPTMPELGGPDFDTLFVTSASFPVRNPEDDPHAGALLALEAPAPGLPMSYMQPQQEPAR